ncbi:MAG: hypothetical protein Q9162_003146 [Coniocarpon cinnabarinum]
MGLLPLHQSLSPPTSPLDTNSQEEKVRFLAEIREFLALFETQDMQILREEELRSRSPAQPTPFADLKTQLRDILELGPRQTRATGLPLQRQTEAQHSNTIFDIIRIAHDHSAHVPQETRVLTFQDESRNHSLFLLLHGNDLSSAYGRLKDEQGISHELFLHEATRPLSPSHVDGYRSVAEQTERYQLLAVSTPSSG